MPLKSSNAFTIRDVPQDQLSITTRTDLKVEIIDHQKDEYESWGATYHSIMLQTDCIHWTLVAPQNAAQSQTLAIPYTDRRVL